MIFEISPTEEVGDFEVKAKFMGVQMETFMLHYQVRTVLFNTGIQVPLTRLLVKRIMTCFLSEQPDKCSQKKPICGR